MGALAELAADVANPLVYIGANNPPEPTPFEAIKVHIEDLMVEARNWCDGTTVETQVQADEASRLIDDLRKAAKAAEDAKDDEQAPHDDAITEIRSRYNPLIQDPKTKNPGKVWKAIDALKATVKPFLDKLEAERLAAVEKARQEAVAAAAKAAEAAKVAAASDLAAKEAAENLIQAARHAAADAKRLENSRTQARGGERAMGLTKTYTARVDDPRALLLHYWGSAGAAGVNRDPIIACLRQMAQADVDRKIHTIPGVFVVEGTRL